MRETIKEKHSSSLNVVAAMTAYFGKVSFKFSTQTFIKMTKMQLYPLFSLTVCVCRGKGAATIQLSGCSRCAFIDHSRAFIPWKPPQEQKRFLICKAPYARNTQTFCSGPQMLCMNGSKSVKFSFLLSVSQFLFPP